MKKIILLICILLLIVSSALSVELVQINPLEEKAVSVNVLASQDDETIVEILLNHYLIASIEIERE